MPSLNYCKGQVAGTVLNGCIYVIGGSDDLLREGLKTVEKYNPFTNKWEAVSPMRVGRGALGKCCVSRLCFLGTIRNRICDLQIMSILYHQNKKRKIIKLKVNCCDNTDRILR